MLTGLPLTVQQESALLLNTVAADGAAYNMAAGFIVCPSISVEQLQRGIGTVLSRHDLLRSTFHADPAGAHRVISEDAAIEPELVDGTTLNTEQIYELAQKFVRRTFMLGQQLPVRCLLVARSAEEALLVLVVHHIAGDFLSFGVILEDLITSAIRPDLELPPVEHSFTDYVRSERQWLDCEEAASARKHWLSLLEDVNPVLDLPGDLPRPAGYRLVGDTVDFDLSHQLVADLKAVCRECGVTPFTFLLTTLIVLLQRYSGQREFVLGSAFGTRGRRNAHVVGPFVNTMPIKAGPRANLTVAELSKSLAEQIAISSEHARYPFSLLPGDLGVPRDLSRTPLVQVLMTMLAVGRDNEVIRAIAEGTGAYTVIEGHRLEALNLQQQEGQFDLGVEIYQTPQAVRGRLKFNDEIFTRVTAEQMVRHYTTLIKAAVNNPNELIDRLSMVDQAEKARLLAFSSGV
ncbi:condensation domain-containing protein [Nocardia sp. NBC_01499]|uniref:condensation domain-containing protein n=1 Tax=Nocardia sp. NBC_01499 TaxID=2903597 RepID=UPI00386F0793